MVSAAGFGFDKQGSMGSSVNWGPESDLQGFLQGYYKGSAWVVLN